MLISGWLHRPWSQAFPGLSEGRQLPPWAALVPQQVALWVLLTRCGAFLLQKVFFFWIRNKAEVLATCGRSKHHGIFQSTGVLAQASQPNCSLGSVPPAQSSTGDSAGMWFISSLPVLKEHPQRCESRARRVRWDLWCKRDGTDS